MCVFFFFRDDVVDENVRFRVPSSVAKVLRRGTMPTAFFARRSDVTRPVSYIASFAHFSAFSSLHLLQPPSSSFGILWNPPESSFLLLLRFSHSSFSCVYRRTIQIAWLVAQIRGRSSFRTRMSSRRPPTLWTSGSTRRPNR